MQVDIFGYPVSAAGLAADVETAWSLIHAGGRGHYVACANPHSLVVADGDPAFAAALRDADLLLPDGAGIVLAGRLLGRPVAHRVPGLDLFLALSSKAQANGGLRYFFLGSTEEVLARIRARLAADFPAIEVCGTYSPPFKAVFSEADDARMLEAIATARPDVVWVGMTAPKQETWIAAHRGHVQAPLLGAIGAAFDFYAGTRKRAPQWVCRLGLEWLPRLVREPRRLWRRNFVSTPRFLWRLARELYAERTAP